MLFGAIRPSADGKRLFAEGRKGRGELIRYDEQRHAFVPFFGGIWASDLSFSRDGKWVAYVSYPEATLWRSRVDGSDRLQLTFTPVIPAVPRWSPDGTQIAFLNMQAGRPWKVLVISAQGGAAQELLSENVFQLDPGWSTDGKLMIFNSRPEMGHPETYTIQLLDLSSKQVSIIPGSQGLMGPRWSPDGRYIAAQTFDGKKVVLFDFKRKKWSDLVSGSGTRGWLAWSWDGKYLYFDATGEEAPGYYRIQLGQTRPELVVDLKDLKRYFGLLGTWSGITPDGSPLFVRDLSIDEIYALDLELP